jgi:hypothetical protein
MYEWVLLRIVIISLLLIGGLLFALAATAFDRWRKRRAGASGARESADSVAKHCGNLTEFDRWRMRRARSFNGPVGNDPAAKARGELTHVTTRGVPRSMQAIGAIGRH